MNLRVKRILFWSVALVGICTISFYLWLNSQTANNNRSPLYSSKPLSRRKPILTENAIYSDSGPSLINIGDLLAHCIVALRLGGKQVVGLSENKQLNIGSKGKTLEGVDDVVTEADKRSHKEIVELLADAYPRLRVVSEEDDSYISHSNHIKNKRTKANLSVDRIELSRMLNDEMNHIGSSPQISLEDTLIWIDPLDATKEYSEKLNHFVTLMACIVHAGKPVAGIIFKPFKNEIYWSWYNHRVDKAHFSSDLKHIIDLSSRSEADNQDESTKRINFIISRSHAGNLENVIKKSYLGSISNITPAGGAGYKTIELLSKRVDAYVHMTRIKKWDICAPSAILNSVDGYKLTDLNGSSISFDDSMAKVVNSGVLATANLRLHNNLIKVMSDRNNL